MHSIAAASSSGGVGIWAYLAVFAATVAGYMGIPFVGAAAVCTAAVLASQGELNIAVVFIVAATGTEVGGLLGYKIGDRWGRQFLEHPGPALELRKKAVAKGEAVYKKWGRAAVFFTPSMVSGTLEMKFSQFAIWNFFAGVAFILSVGPAAYGAGKVTTGHHDPVSVGMLIGGLAVGAVVVVLIMRYKRRHKARQAAAGHAARADQSAIRRGVIRSRRDTGASLRLLQRGATAARRRRRSTVRWAP